MRFGGQTQNSAMVAATRLRHFRFALQSRYAVSVMPQCSFVLVHRSKAAMVRGKMRRETLEFMPKSNDKGWNTKFGPRRVRQEAPTLAEAIAAAQGMSDDLDAQAEIAASLMGLPASEVRAELRQTRAAAQKRDQVRRLCRPGFGAAHDRGRAQTAVPPTGVSRSSNATAHRAYREDSGTTSTSTLSSFAPEPTKTP